MLNSIDNLKRTNSEQYPRRQSRKSQKMSKTEEILPTAKEMLNHSSFRCSQGRNENELSGTVDNNNHSQNSNIKTRLSGLGTLRSKHKHRQQNYLNLQSCHHHLLGKSQRRRQCYQPHRQQPRWWLLLVSVFIAVAFIEHSVPLAKADQNTEDANSNGYGNDTTTIIVPTASPAAAADLPSLMAMNESVTGGNWLRNDSSKYAKKRFKTKFNADDSIFLRFAKRFADDNNLVSGIIQDCYRRPTFACFQKNVYVYLNEVLDAQDVNVTQRLKFYRNDNAYEEQAEDVEDADENLQTQTESNQQRKTTKASAAMDSSSREEEEEEQEFQENEIPREGRSHNEGE